MSEDWFRAAVGDPDMDRKQTTTPEGCSDIAIRLRSHETEGVTSSDRYHLRNEAAAEIDRLRSLLSETALRDDVLEEAAQRFESGHTVLKPDSAALAAGTLRGMKGKK